MGSISILAAYNEGKGRRTSISNITDVTSKKEKGRDQLCCPAGAQSCMFWYLKGNLYVLHIKVCLLLMGRANDPVKQIYITMAV